MKFKRWGKKKTVRQDKNKKSQLIIRQGDNEIKVKKSEVCKLIVSLLEVAK